MKQRLHAWAAAILAAAWLASGSASLHAQEAPPQRVDSLDGYQKRIEGLIGERVEVPRHHRRFSRNHEDPAHRLGLEPADFRASNL